MDKLHFDEARAGYSGNLKFALNVTTGNSETARGSADMQLQWQRPDYINLVLVGLEYGEASNVKNLDRRFLHLRHIHALTSSLAWEVFVQGQQDEFARLSFRGLLGAGARYAVSGEERYRAFLGAGLMREREDILATVSSSDAGDYQLNRANLYWLWRYQTSKHFSVSGAAYYQPDTANTADYHALAEVSTRSRITDTLHMNLSWSVAYDSQPPAEVARTDVSLKAGIEYEFQ